VYKFKPAMINYKNEIKKIKLTRHFFRLAMYKPETDEEPV